MHVQESVPYGNWQIPIRFVPSSTGGQCAAGCHQALGYDRETPVVYQKAATPEAGPPAAVNPEPPVAPDAGQPVAPAPVPTVPKAQETQP
jgi:hypothetical protein